MELGGLFELSFPKEVMVLQAHPVFGFIAEIAAQLQAMLRGKQSAAGKDVVQQLRANVPICGEL